MTALRNNILASYASQIYVALLSILILPVYIELLGSEAYGLVGFFTMLQAWFALLDLGLSPTISREMARYRGGKLSAEDFLRLYRALLLIFLSLGILGGGGVWYFSFELATSWLNPENLNKIDVIFVIQIIAFCVAFRWMAGLFRGILIGAERLTNLSLINATIATLRFLGVIVTMYIWGADIVVFFWHQLAVAVLEILIIFMLSRVELPAAVNLNGPIGWSFRPIKSVLKFSLGIALTATIWVMVTQVDKLILSGILSLEDYGYFSLCVIFAAGILTLSTPVSAAIMPKMANLFARSEVSKMTDVYRNCTQLVSVIAGTAAVFIAIYSEEILYVWTGDINVAENYSLVLTLYSAGYGILAVSAFPYYLQYAMGNLKYHVIGNVGTILVFIPSIVIASTSYGAVGAGWVWLTVHSIYFLFWVGYIHRKILPGFHIGWLFNDVLRIYCPMSFAGILLSVTVSGIESRWALLFYLAMVGFLMILISAISSTFVRRALILKFDY